MAGRNIIDIDSTIVDRYGSMYKWRTKVLPYYINNSNEICEHVFIYVENQMIKDCEFSVYKRRIL